MEIDLVKNLSTSTASIWWQKGYQCWVLKTDNLVINISLFVLPHPYVTAVTREVTANKNLEIGEAVWSGHSPQPLATPGAKSSRFQFA